MKIWIDAGHGGIDSGALGQKGTQEKDITLIVSKLLRKMLIDSGDSVGMTRTTDESVGLSQRATLANNWGADLFLSIHCDSYTNAQGVPQGDGIGTFIHPNKAFSKPYATAVQDKLVSYLQLRDRGVKTANYAVLRETKMQAVLVELAFINNLKEEALLNNPSFQEKAAIALFEGITGESYKIVEEEPEMIYNYIDKNMPEWARPTIQKLVDKGALKGDESGELGLNDTMLKVFVVNDRLGLYDK